LKSQASPCLFLISEPSRKIEPHWFSFLHITQDENPKLKHPNEEKSRKIMKEMEAIKTQIILQNKR
jgi:NADH:ubiquinone oxidoreductase subunit